MTQDFQLITNPRDMGNIRHVRPHRPDTILAYDSWRMQLTLKRTIPVYY